MDVCESSGLELQLRSVVSERVSPSTSASTFCSSLALRTREFAPLRRIYGIVTTFQTLSTAEAAAIMGISIASVKRRCESGEFAGAEKIGRRWYIPRSALPIEAPATELATPAKDWRDPIIEQLDAFPATVSIQQASEFLRMSERAIVNLLTSEKLVEIRSGRLRRVSTPSIRSLLLGGTTR